MNPRALHFLSYGMYVVGARDGQRINGQIANAIMQVCADPPAVAVCTNKKNLMHEIIEKGGSFTVSVLSEETPLSFIGRFGFRCGRDLDKFEGVGHRAGVTGAPVCLDHALAHIEAKVIKRLEVYTHTLFDRRGH